MRYLNNHVVLSKLPSKLLQYIDTINRGKLFPTPPQGLRQQFWNMSLQSFSLQFLFFCNSLLVALLLDHSNRRHPSWPKSWPEQFHVYWNLAVFQYETVWATKTFTKFSRVKSLTLWGLNLKVTYNCKAKEFSAPSVGGKHGPNEVLSKADLKFYTSKFIKARFYSQRHASGNFYTRGKSTRALHWNLKFIMMFYLIFKRI